ncbi:MAG: DSD1 family PLP-dependent enzyme [Clostridiales bacterium]|nr:DSD1 family PLP-dependent enzyme [Clostridiales bacterium]
MKVCQIETPALILDLDVMERNMAVMKAFTDSVGIRLRPHYKSHKCTSIAHMQMAAGAKGLCCAKTSEAADLVRAGIEDLLIANQVTEPAKIAQVASLAKCCRLTVCVDSAQNVRDLEAAAAVQDSLICCLVEFDIGMGRCGVATREEVLALADQISACPHLHFEGIQAYAGHLAHQTDLELRRQASGEIEQALWKLRRFLEERGYEVKEISGVSTGTAMLRSENSVYTEIQAGSYLFMDTAYNALNLAFSNSLFVLATVIRLGGGLLVTDAGLKSVSVDQRPPVFREYPDLPIRFSEEHSTLVADRFSHAVGDRLCMVPSHCCTTVNLHDFFYFVRGDRVVDRVPVTSRGKSL